MYIPFLFLIQTKFLMSNSRCAEILNSHNCAKAGWARASTGYAFLPIQKAIQDLAFDQRKRKSLNIDLYLDQIFLAFLHDHSQSGPGVFFGLFRKNSPERLIRFLTGQRSFVDLLQVLFSMPKITMIKQALRLITKGGM